MLQNKINKNGNGTGVDEGWNGMEWNERLGDGVWENRTERNGYGQLND
jgi:hypothetical protein